MKTRILALLLVLGAVVISNESYASRARTMVLGTGSVGALDEGSYFYEDAYNMFYNPAYVNDYKDWIIFEKSNFPGSTSMGGFTTGLGPVAFGAFFNRVSGAHNLIDGTNLFQDPPSALNDPNTALNRTNMKPIDIMIGMDHGAVKWGFGVNYANYRDNTAAANGKARSLTLRGGATFMGFDPYIDWTTSGHIRDDAPFAVEYKAKHVGAGLRYHYGDWTPYAGFRTDRINTRKNTAWGVGLGRSMKFGDSGVGINYALSVWRNMTSAAGRRTTVPVDLSIEGDAADWLTLRAGTHFRLLDRVNGNDQTDTTTGRVGGTFHVKKVDFNFAVGSGAATTTEAAGTTNGQVFGISENFFTAASVEYHW